MELLYMVLGWWIQEFAFAETHKTVHLKKLTLVSANLEGRNPETFRKSQDIINPWKTHHLNQKIKGLMAAMKINVLGYKCMWHNLAGEMGKLTKATGNGILNGYVKLRQKGLYKNSAHWVVNLFLTRVWTINFKSTLYVYQGWSNQ